MIFEVRDYHYQRDIFDACKKWAEDATKVLREEFDVVGFWIDEAEIAPEIEGTNLG